MRTSGRIGHHAEHGMMDRILSGVRRPQTPVLMYSPPGALPIELVGRSRWIEGPGLLGIGISNHGHRGMLGMPTSLRMAGTGVRWPWIYGCAQSCTHQPRASGARFRHRHTHGAPPGGVSIGHAGELGGSTGPHEGGPVVRGTSSRGRRGYSVAITAKELVKNKDTVAGILDSTWTWQVITFILPAPTVFPGEPTMCGPGAYVSDPTEGMVDVK